MSDARRSRALKTTELMRVMTGAASSSTIVELSMTSSPCSSSRRSETPRALVFALMTRVEVFPRRSASSMAGAEATTTSVRRATGSRVQSALRSLVTYRYGACVRPSVGSGGLPGVADELQDRQVDREKDGHHEPAHEDQDGGLDDRRERVEAHIELRVVEVR